MRQLYALTAHPQQQVVVIGGDPGAQRRGATRRARVPLPGPGTQPVTERPSGMS
jgi:hypothetical protein